MKTDRITIAQLKQRLAKEQHISDREAAIFLDALFSQIISGLQEDGQVRISGLGQLKIQWNEPRKSVDVNTGNEITISGYNKVTLATEPVVKDRINKDILSLNNTTDDIDPIQKLGEQADAIMNIVADINGFSLPQNSDNQDIDAIDDSKNEEIIDEHPIEVHPKDETIEEKPTEEVQEIEKEDIKEEVKEEVKEEKEEVKEEDRKAEVKEEEKNVIIPTPTPTPTPTPAPAPTPTQTTPIQTTPTQTTPTQTIPNPSVNTTTTFTPPRITQANEPKEAKTHNKILIIIGIIIAIILLLAIVGYFVFQPQVDQWINDIITKFRQTEQVETTGQQSLGQDETLIIDTEAETQNEGESTETAQQTNVKTAEQNNENKKADNVKQTTKNTQATSSAGMTENSITIPEEPGLEPRYDVIKSGITIAALARKYYNGQTDFWVYIYDANRDQLSSPNSAKLGMKLRIPYLDDRDPDVIMEAQRRAAEYKKK